MQVEPSAPFGDAPCPRCGSLLWFLEVGNSLQFYEFEDAKLFRDRAIRVAAETLGVDEDEIRNNPAFLQASGADSLDMVELVTEFESEFDK